jgi:hypothetical protein
LTLDASAETVGEVAPFGEVLRTPPPWQVETDLNGPLKLSALGTVAGTHYSRLAFRMGPHGLLNSELLGVHDGPVRLA